MKNIISTLCFILFITFPNSHVKGQQIHASDLAQNINVDDHYKNGNWESVLNAVKNKSIVLLGELNHGSKQIFASRNDLIMALHKQLNFDVILFESGVGEVGAIEIQRKSLSDKQMTYGFFSGWRTNEFRDLMSYIKSNRIPIGGFDVQKTGSGFNTLFKEYMKKKAIDSSLYSNIEERFNHQKKLLTSRKAVYDSLNTSTLQLVDDYQALLGHLKDKATKEDLIIQRTITNRISYLQYFLEFIKTKDWNKRWKVRDKMMASNIEWLIETMYKDKKIIIVAHNYHIAKFNKKQEVMGEFLMKTYGSKMYVLGIFAGSGSYADNSGKEKQMMPVENDGTDIKKIILVLKNKVHFIDIPNERSQTNEFLFNDIIINDTFIDLYGSNQLILSKHFDGILLIDKISPPD